MWFSFHFICVYTPEKKNLALYFDISFKKNS